MAQEFMNVKLKFKDEKITSKILLAHFFINDKEMYFQIIDNDPDSDIDVYFANSINSLGLFKDNFEVIETEISLDLDECKIYKFITFQENSHDRFFTVFVNKVTLKYPNKYNACPNEGEAYLNKNGLKIVNSFYSFFSNLKDKNIFKISRMNGLSTSYKAKQISFIPELEFIGNDSKISEEFKVKKVPIIKYNYEDLCFEKVKNTLHIICKFLSFCFGIRVVFETMIYRNADHIFVYRDKSPNNKTFVSEFLDVFPHLEKNFDIDKILNTNWFIKYIEKEKTINRAIDNYLHSREVDLSASFLLLFNIIEIFNGKQKIEKFDFNKSKNEKFNEAFEIIASSLVDAKDKELLEDKWVGLINKIEIKPLKSPLEETLIRNNINSNDFGYDFATLKSTRDKLTHGSVNTISENELRKQINCIRIIASRLILANLGFRDDLNPLYDNFSL